MNSLRCSQKLDFSEQAFKFPKLSNLGKELARSKDRGLKFLVLVVLFRP